jgi:hypothetical protein
MDQDHKDYAEPGEIHRRRLTLPVVIFGIVAILFVVFTCGAAAFFLFIMAFAWTMSDFN